MDLGKDTNDTIDTIGITNLVSYYYSIYDLNSLRTAVEFNYELYFPIYSIFIVFIHASTYRQYIRFRIRTSLGHV